MKILPRQSEIFDSITVAYFSMEVMLETDIPTYAGGLGMLAGDILRSLADKNIPACGVSIAFEHGYMNQTINADGSQIFVPSTWSKNDQLAKLSETVKIKLDNQEFTIACYRYDIVGDSGFVVPVYMLTTDYFENTEEQKAFTRNLYDSDTRIRLIQEAILGIGGVKMLRQMGYKKIDTFQLNEGHTAFLTLELLKEQNYDEENVRKQCSFTMHTPVAAGRDAFDYELSYRVLGEFLPWDIKDLAGDSVLEMSKLAHSLSKFTNGVSRKHGEVSSDMFQQHIDYITNGVHADSWLSPISQEVYDKYIPEWRENISFLRDAENIPDDALVQMHSLNKKNLIDFVNYYLDKKNDPGCRLDYETLTLTFARRCVAYKRPDLIFYDLKRLLRMGIGRLQIIFSGKTHPTDAEAAEILKKIISYRNKFSQVLNVVYIENYNPAVAKYLYPGSDIWLSNPVVPLEASGTSGMKAAMNGCINLSNLDGWFIEGVEIEPQSSFIFGKPTTELFPKRNDEEDADALYSVLEDEVIPMYYENQSEWLKKMKSSIKLGAYFNTDRVVDQYMERAWTKS